MKNQNSFTTKNKVNKNKDNPFNIYKANKRNLKSRLSDKKINKKTLASSSTSNPYKNKSSTFSNIKPLYSFKETLNKAYTKLNSVLRSYNMSKEAINIRIANDIIFDEKKRIVSIFKDYLLWDETSDFFRQYYKKNKSIRMILRFITYYETYTNFYPEYGPHEDILKILKKNIKKKRKYYERIEEDVANKYIIDKNDNKNNQKFERIIKDSEIKLSHTNSNYLQKNNSKSTLVLDYSTDKDNKNNKNNNINKSIDNNKDFYYILKTFIDYDDINYDNKDIYTSEHFNDYDNIFMFNSKLSKYFKKSFNEDKNNEPKTDRNILISTNKKHQKYNLNVLSNVIYQKERPKSKDEKLKKLLDKGKKSTESRLTKKVNNQLIRTVNQTSKKNKKICESNSILTYKKLYSIKYNVQTHIVKSKPQNIKKLFNSYNKYEKYENNSSINNYYSLFPFRYTEGNNRSRQSPKSVVNNSPLYLRMRNNLIISTVKNKNNHIFNFERLKKINNINPIKFSNTRNNMSEIENNNNKDSNYFINSNNLHINLNYNKIPSNLRKVINITKRNKITKISPIKKSRESTQKKKKKNIINKNKSENPFKIESSSTIYNSTNYNILLSSKQKSKKNYSNKNAITSTINYNSYKDDDKNASKKKDKLKKIKNNLILIKTNMSLAGTKTNSLKKKNKILTIKTSFSMNNKNKGSSKKIIDKKKIESYSNEKNKNDNYIIKNNNILKNAIDKSSLRNEIKKKLTTNNNSILKSCCSNTNNFNSAKSNNFIFDDFDKIDINKRNPVKQFSFLNFDENYLLKNKIKNKYENFNNNGSRKARICLRLPMTNNINKI